MNTRLDFFNKFQQGRKILPNFFAFSGFNPRKGLKKVEKNT